MIGELRK